MRTSEPSRTSASRRILHCCAVHNELKLSKFHDTYNIFVATGTQPRTCGSRRASFPVRLAPKVHWPRAVRWVFKEPLRQEDFEPFSGLYIGEAFRLKWGQGDGCTSSAFKQWSHTGGFLAYWVYGEFMSRCGSVHKKFRVIGNWTCCHQTRIARHCTRTSRHPCVLSNAPQTRNKHCYCPKSKAP